MQHAVKAAALALLIGSLAACASAGAGGTAASGVSQMDRGTAARLADEGAVPDRAAAAGSTGGELSGSAR